MNIVHEFREISEKIELVHENKDKIIYCYYDLDRNVFDLVVDNKSFWTKCFYIIKALFCDPDYETDVEKVAKNLNDYIGNILYKLKEIRFPQNGVETAAYNKVYARLRDNLSKFHSIFAKAYVRQSLPAEIPQNGKPQKISKNALGFEDRISDEYMEEFEAQFLKSKQPEPELPKFETTDPEEPEEIFELEL